VVESDRLAESWLDWGMAFVLHPRLAASGTEIGQLGCCRLLLKNNALFPWLIIVPEVEPGVEDLHQLTPEQFDDVMTAVRRVSEFAAGYFKREKLNVASIGNQVRQMHIHVVGRSAADPAWPGTVWAFGGKIDYTAAEIDAIRSAARSALGMG